MRRPPRRHTDDVALAADGWKRLAFGRGALAKEVRSVVEDGLAVIEGTLDEKVEARSRVVS